MALQQVTLNVTAQTIAGASPAGTKLRLTLAGYGAEPPTVMGVGIATQLSQDFTFTSSGTLTILLWGNDVLSPAGTYYCAQWFDARGNIVAAQNYQMVGTGALDLTLLAPYDPTKTMGLLYLATLNNQGPQGLQGTPGGIAGALYEQVPAGTIDGANRIFTVLGQPSLGMLFKNGELQVPGTDYTRSSGILTYTVAPKAAPVDGSDQADEHYWYGLNTTLVYALPSSYLLTDTANGNTYVLQAVSGALTVSQVTLGSGAAAAPSGMPLADLYSGASYILQSVNGQPTLSTFTPSAGQSIPGEYGLQDALNGASYVLLCIAGQLTLSAQIVTTATSS